MIFAKSTHTGIFRTFLIERELPDGLAVRLILHTVTGWLHI